MTKVITSELQSANDSKGLKLLSDNANSLRALKSVIGESISDSQVQLTGPAYDAIRGKLSSYITQIGNMANICESLSGNIKSANNQMIGYMEGYPELNDADKSSICADINYVSNELHNIYIPPEPLVTDENFDSIRATIDYLEGYKAYLESELAELEALYDKLVGLAPADSNAYSLIASGESELGNISSSISQINVAQI